MNNYEDMSKGELIALIKKRNAPDVQGESVGWQFYQHGEWWNGDHRIKDHRKNTEEAGFRVRDVYAAPQPAEQQPAPDSIEVAAKKLAELFSYPWEYMPEQGRQSMRDNVKAVLIAAHRKGGSYVA